MATTQGVRSIPQPDPNFLTEYLTDVGASTLIQQLMEVAKVYGPVFQLPIPGQDRVTVAGYGPMPDVCDEQRFGKAITGAAQTPRSGSLRCQRLFSQTWYETEGFQARDSSPKW